MLNLSSYQSVGVSVVCFLILRMLGHDAAAGCTSQKSQAGGLY